MAGAFASILCVAGCTTPSTVDTPRPALAAAWRSPLPHDGSIRSLETWWSRFDDRLLPELISRAQARSPTLALALARQRQAEAQVLQAQALLGPSTRAQAQLSRARSPDTRYAATTTSTTGLAPTWEIDLFGSQRARAAADAAEAKAATAQWHEARVSLAAEVALAYLQLRHAQAQEEVLHLDLQLAEQLALWARQQQRAGVLSASDAALANTERAVAAANLSLQRAEAQIALQALATLTAEDGARLVASLAPPALSAGFSMPARRVPDVPAIGVDTVPAALLAQRPDVAAAHQRWLAAVEQQRSVDAGRYPQLSLGALIGTGYLRAGGTSIRGSTWSLAPTLALPLFDGGLIAAQRQGAAAAVDEAAARLQQAWLAAVGEVEESLQRLQASGERLSEVEAAQREWQGIAERTAAQAAAGVESGVRRANGYRNALSAYRAALTVRQERATAWIRLYRTLGGGWVQEAAPTSTVMTTP